MGGNCESTMTLHCNKNYLGQVVSVTTSLTTFLSLMSNTRTLPTFVPSNSCSMQTRYNVSSTPLASHTNINNPGHVQNTESGFPWLSRTSSCAFSMSFQDCLIEWVSNTSDFHIRVLNQLNNRSKWGWQWTMIIYVKGRRTRVSNAATFWFILHDFSWLSTI